MSARSALAVECRFGTRDAVPSPRLLRRWASAALGVRGAGRELALCTVGAARMRALNRRYRGKDKPTNVLAFPAQPQPAAPGAGPLPLGDVVICPAVLLREAREQGKAARAHWAHLVVHGALHLAGYDHEREADARRMERREISVLRALGFGNPYRPSAARGARR
ncbi:MAG TPA: rRNA maturation RNase YbeY [Steroidobacteraceae bacterium]|nr:rRNA maturation RNase YbeY [Steroidobacteraceae bacterium]